MTIKRTPLVQGWAGARSRAALAEDLEGPEKMHGGPGDSRASCGNAPTECPVARETFL